MKNTIEFKVNGQIEQVSVVGNETLLDCLREQLGLTGSKKGCEQGDCGACTVLVDGMPVNSCLMLACEVSGKEVTTIEGVAQDNRLNPVQQAFIRYNAIQCGYCTPGMILTAVALLQENPQPTEEEIRRYLQGNLCRCTGYSKIVQAVHAASQQVSPVEGGEYGK